MSVHNVIRLELMVQTEKELARMSGDEYKRHLLNHMSYSHAYLSGAAVELMQANPTALCEAAMHAAACAWCLADYHNEATNPDTVAAAAWEGIANRWIKAVEKWSKQIKSNQAAAYAAPIRERAALKELPRSSGKTGFSGSTRPEGTTNDAAINTDTGWLASGMPSSGPITVSGATRLDEDAARAAFFAPPAPKRSHKKKPAGAGS